MVCFSYGFVTFERQEDAQALIRKDRKEVLLTIFVGPVDFRDELVQPL